MEEETIGAKMLLLSEQFELHNDLILSSIDWLYIYPDMLIRYVDSYINYIYPDILMIYIDFKSLRLIHTGQMLDLLPFGDYTWGYWRWITSSESPRSQTMNLFSVPKPCPGWTGRKQSTAFKSLSHFIDCSGTLWCHFHGHWRTLGGSEQSQNVFRHEWSRARPPGRISLREQKQSDSSQWPY
jgi:hypothetical protein